MNPFAKAARLLLRLVAVGVILVCGLLILVELLPLLRHHDSPVVLNRFKIILNTVLFVDGILLLIFSGKLADKIASRMDQ
jgi:uncharacterized protein YhhL (DUF1145 family)